MRPTRPPDLDVRIESFDPDEAGIGSCPYPAFAALRDEAPVHEVPGRNFFLVSRYEDCLTVLKDVAGFSNDHHLLLERHGEQLGWRPPARFHDVEAIYAAALPNIETLHFLDPPLHTQQRRRISRWFTSRRSQSSWLPIVERTVDELVGSFERDGRVELMSQFAVPLPIRAIASVLGVPADREVEFKEWSDAFVAGMGLRLTHEGWRRKAQAHVDMQQFFMEEIERRLVTPHDDLLGELVAAARQPEPGREAERSGPDEDFTVLEILNAVQHLLAAGNETTTQAIGLAVRLLVEHPDQLERLRAEPDLLPRAIEETLRVEAPVLGMWRYCRRTTEVGGVVIPEGALVAVLFGAANHDERCVADPDAFRVDREDASRHLSFGHGVHFCVGAGLARVELQVGLQALIDRLPGLRLAAGAELVHGESYMLRNLHALPLEFDPR